MSIDRKDVQILASNVAKILMKSSYTFLKQRPIASSTLLLFLLLYIFVPSIFWFLIYSLPFVVFIAISVRIYTSVRKAKDINKDENGSDLKSSRKIRFAEDDNKKYNSVHARSVRRRRAKETIREGYTQSGFQEKGTVYPTRFTNDLVDKSALIEENPKEIREVEVESVINRADCTSSSASQGIRTQFHDDSFIGSQRFSCGAVEMEGVSSENTEDEDEDRRGDERKAVQWNEDDQKNLMDLGTSEIERNKRLESLIARRRARKLLSLQVRRTLMNMGGNDTSSLIASIMIPKHNPFLPGSSQFSPAPGSAPSVLLPMRNPFDLPYEPHEEKPNLTGDSFHQEFMVSHQKETMFCRHESFSLGAFLPGELKQDLHETSLYHDHGIKQVNSERPESSKLGSHLDQENDEKVTKHRPSQEAESELKIENIGDHVTVQAPEQGPDLVDIPREEFDSEVQTKSVIVEDCNGRLSSPSSSEEDEPFCRIDKDAILKSLSSPAPRNIATDREGSGRIDDILCDYGPSDPEKTRREERYYYADKTMHHTPSHSIASDLQVEVSEVGSPPLTNDGNISSPDEEISSCDGNTEKDVTSCSEDMWVASSHLSRVDENESRSREIREVSEQDIIEVGFSRIDEKSGIPIASPVVEERVVEQDSIYPHSHSPSENEPPEESEARTTFVNYSIHEKFQGSSPDFSQALTPEVLAFPLNGKVQQSTGTSLAHPSCSIDSENLEEPSQPTNMSKEQSSTISSHPGPHVNRDIDNIKTVQEIGDEDRELESQANIRGMLNTCNTSDSSSAEHISGQSGEPSDIRTVFEIKSSVEDNGNSRSSEIFNEDTEYLSQSEHAAEKFQLVESNEIQDTKVSQSDGIASPSLPELGVAPIGTVSASSVFPDPLLHENAGMDESCPSNAEKLMHVNIQESDTDMIHHNECSVAPNESSKPRDAHNSLHPAWDSRLQFSNGQNSEPSYSETSKRQLGIINNVDDSHILENNDQENLTTCKEVDIHHSTKRGGEQTEMSACSKSFESLGRQFEGLVEPTIVSDCDKLVGESSKPTFSEESKEKMPQQEEMITPIQANFVPESTNGTENEPHSAVVGTSRVSQDINDPPEVELMPEVVDEQVPTALSSSLSPKSVLRPNFSMDLSSVSSLSPEVQMEMQQSDRYTLEINTLDERASSSSTSTPIQSAGPLMENRIAETIQDSSTSSMMPTEAANCIEGVNELVVHDEKMQITKPDEFPKDTSGRFSSHEIIAELAKPTVHTNFVLGKNDDMQETSTSYSKIADKQKNFDMPLTNEQDNIMQLAFSFWTNVISGPEEKEKAKKEKRHQSKPSTNDQFYSQSSGRLSSHEILAKLGKPTSSMMPAEEANCIEGVNKLVVHDEKMQITKLDEFPKDTSGRLSSHEIIAELAKPTVDTNSILGKNDDMPETSTSYSKTADKQKNFDIPLTNEQDNMMQLAFSFWTNVISGPEENEKAMKEKKHQSRPSSDEKPHVNK